MLTKWPSRLRIRPDPLLVSRIRILELPTRGSGSELRIREPGSVRNIYGSGFRNNAGNFHQHKILKRNIMWRLVPGPGLLVPELALSHKTLRKLGHAEIYRVLGRVVGGQPPKSIPYYSCKGVKNRHRYFFLVANVYPAQFICFH
jgi:hypothetical protein